MQRAPYKPPPRALWALVLTGFLALAPSGASAVFHVAVINEVMTSYNGSPNVQFVEIKMLGSFQNLVTNTVLGAFDASGAYLGDVLIVPGNVANHGRDVTWLMGTTMFQQVSGLQPDFIMPAGLPTGGGMVCWGAPGISAPLPGTWDHTIETNYVDCLAYGSYSGPSNLLIGTPTTDLPEGHSLTRINETRDNATDFLCSDPATPTRNTGTAASLVASIPCSVCGNGVAELPFEECDGTDDAACTVLCLPDCTCTACGNDARGPGEACDGSDDVACPGLCDPSCQCPMGQADDDADGISDAEDVCTTLTGAPSDPPTSPPGQTPSRLTIILKDLDKPGLEDLIAKGFFNPATEVPAVDPKANGVHVRLTNAGNVLLDVSIPGDQDVPGGDYGKGTELCGNKRDGWTFKESPSGVQLWKYLNKSRAIPPDCAFDSAQGIALVLIKKIPRKSSFQFIVKTKDHAFAVDPESPPMNGLQLSLALESQLIPGVVGDASILGQCSEAALLPASGETTVGVGPAKPFCKAAPKGAVPPQLKKIICKGL